MAHKGKIYKLAFSRDIALGLASYRTAMASQYDCTILGTKGSVGDVMDGVVVRLTELPRLPANLVRWSSGQFPVGANVVEYFLDAAVVNLPQQMRMTLSVQVNLLTTAFRLYFDAAQGSDWHRMGADSATTPILLVPPYFTQGFVGPPVWEADAVEY